MATERKAAIVTGAASGLGRAMALGLVGSGIDVVAVDRNATALAALAADVTGTRGSVLTLPADLAEPEAFERIVAAARERFGRIDVLVNNAANSQMGYFEEISPEAFERQLATNLLGPLNVTRAVLPVMRKQRSGHIISISSTAGIVGWEFTSAYAASKFGLEGWMESLQPEVAPSGIRTTIVEPGFFRTELLEDASVSYGDLSVQDYADRTAEQLKWWKAQNGRQSGDPAKLGRALVTIADHEQPPLRFVAGADAVAVVEQKAADLKEQVDAFRDLSTSLALDELEPAGSAR